MGTATGGGFSAGTGAEGVAEVAAARRRSESSSEATVLRTRFRGRLLSFFSGLAGGGARLLVLGRACGRLVM